MVATVVPLCLFRNGDALALGACWCQSSLMVTGKDGVAPEARVTRRRAAVTRELLDAAWRLIERDDVAALTLRELGAQLGMRPQSLSEYFPTKADLLDALFRDGFSQATERLLGLPQEGDLRTNLVGSVGNFLDFCVSNPGRFHLMLQRAVPGFTPSPESLRCSAASLQIMLDRAAAAGLREAADLDLLRALISGLASEQIANEPGGRRFISQADRAVSLLLIGSSEQGAPQRLQPGVPPTPHHTQPQKGPNLQETGHHMTISGLHHAMLTVSDLDRSNHFYGGVLGLATFRAIPDDGVAGAKVIYSLPDGNYFGIVQHSRGDKTTFDEMRTGLDHISFTVTAEELTAWQHRFGEAGISSSEPAPAASGELVIVVRDPDNIQVQIFGRRSSPLGGARPTSESRKPAKTVLTRKAAAK